MTLISEFIANTKKKQINYPKLSIQKTESTIKYSHIIEFNTKCVYLNGFAAMDAQDFKIEKVNRVW